MTISTLAMLLIQTALFVGSGFALWFVCFAWTCRWFQHHDPLLRWCASGVLGLWLLVSSGLILLWCGAFRWYVSLPLALVAFLLTHRWGCSLSETVCVFLQDLRNIQRGLGQIAWRRHPWLLLTLFVMVMLATRAVLLPPLAWDTLTYHAVKSASYVQTGSLSLHHAPSGWGWYRLFPPGGEVLHAWAMLPFHSDFLYASTDIAVFLFLMLTLFVLGHRHLGLSPLWNIMGLAFAFSMPVLWRMFGSGYVDILVHASMLAGTLFSLEYAGASEASSQRQFLLFSWMAFGVAMSVKLPAYPVVLLLLIFQFVVAWRRTAVRNYLCVSWLGLLLFASATLPWIIYNVRETSYPFSPYPLQIAGIKLGHAPVSMEEYKQLFKKPPYTLKSEWDALVKTFWSKDWNDQWLWYTHSSTLGGTTMLLMLFLPWAGLALWRRARLVFVVFALVFVGTGYGFYHPDFSVIRLEWTNVNGRFLLGSVLLAILMVLCWAQHTPRLLRIFSWMLLVFGLWNVWDVVLYIAPHEWVPIFLVMLFIAISGVVLRSVWFLCRSRLAWIIVVVLLVSLGSVGLYSQKQNLRLRAYQDSTMIHSIPRWFHDCLSYLDKTPSQHVAVTAGNHRNHDNWFWYPWMGQLLQHKLLYISPLWAGKVEDYQRGFYARHQHRFDIGDWIKRMKVQNVSTVVAMSPNSLELQWMSLHPQYFQKIAGVSGSWGCFRLQRPQ